jgi:HEAT repeat protein
VGHEEARVRREVARSIGRIRSSDGIELLRGLVTDDNKMVRIASLAAIRDIGDGKARDLVEPLIIDKSFGKKSADEKREVMRTYGSLGPEGLTFLEAVVDGRFKHLDDKACASAVYGIAMIQTHDAMRLLADLARNGKGPTRFAAAEALSTLER